MMFWIVLLIRGTFPDAVGFVIINNTDGEWDNTFTTGLADGTYCDVISGAVSGSSCTGTTYVYNFLSTSMFCLPEFQAEIEFVPMMQYHRQWRQSHRLGPFEGRCGVLLWLEALSHRIRCQLSFSFWFSLDKLVVALPCYSLLYALLVWSAVAYGLRTLSLLCYMDFLLILIGSHS